MGAQTGAEESSRLDQFHPPGSDRFPKALRKKVFHPFYSTKPLGEGSGLGLSVVHGIVKAHQGEIKIKENIPNGSNFQILLPL